jgi:hypothetical protein
VALFNVSALARLAGKVMRFTVFNRLFSGVHVSGAPFPVLRSL